MKKTIFYLSLAVLAVSCVKEQNPGAQAPEKTLAPMEFLACAEQTKTILAEDGMSVEWIEGDQIAVFDGSNMNGEADEGQKFYARSSGSEALISGEADPAVAEYHAIYPYGSGHSLKNGEFTTQIKAQQIVESGSMAGNCAVVVGKAVAGSTKMEFKNVCSLVKFSLEKEGVKSLTLIGNNNEVIAGQFTLIWNNGDPQVTGNTKPEVTVTLRDAEGADLAIGDYYFTILPTEFTKGFSVILGKNDGTQEIISRGAVPALSRNHIFRTQNNIPAAAYKAHESNFVKYNDGFPLTYAGVTVQKGTAEYAKYVNDGVAKISAEGVYFVGSEATTLESSVTTCNSHVFAGDNPSVRSRITMKKALQPQTNDNGYIVLADLNIESNLSQIFYQPDGGFSSFGDIVVSDCQINAITTYLATFAKANSSLNSLVVEDSDLLLNVTATATQNPAYMLNFGAKTASITNVKFHNNVFQDVATSSTLTRFRFVMGETAATVNDVTITNNTLVGMLLNQHGYVRVQQLNGTTIVENNFFIESHPKSSQIGILYSKNCGDTMTYSVKNNVFYVADAIKKIVLAEGKEATASAPAEGTFAQLEGKTGTFYEVRSFTTYPLSDGWNPANGIFGYKEGLKFGKLQSDGTVPEEASVSAKWGAQRTTSAAVLNRAGYNYTSEDLGTL